jgi:hypothetical protein
MRPYRALGLAGVFEEDAVEGVDLFGGLQILSAECGMRNGGRRRGGGGVFGSAGGFFGLRHRVGSIDQKGGKIKANSGQLKMKNSKFKIEEAEGEQDVSHRFHRKHRKGI